MMAPVLTKSWHSHYVNSYFFCMLQINIRYEIPFLLLACLWVPFSVAFNSLLFWSTCRGCQPPQSDHTTASAAPSTQPPHLIPPVCQQPEQKYPERGTQPHSRPCSRHRRRADHPGVRAAARQLGPQQQRPAGDQVRSNVFLIICLSLFCSLLVYLTVIT